VIDSHAGCISACHWRATTRHFLTGLARHDDSVVSGKEGLGSPFARIVDEVNLEHQHSQCCAQLVVISLKRALLPGLLWG